jgi:tripartite-type tricarboxylate transporter receptor subunit TctC
VPIVAINKTGGSGTIGTTYVSRAKKDGYTLLMGTPPPMVVAPFILEVPYDPVKDFIPIAYVSMSPGTIFVRSDSPFKTLENLIDMVKKNPKSISCGTAGVATEMFVNLHIFQKAAGIEFNIVSFKGGVETPIAVLGGHLDCGIAVLTNVLPYLQAGSLRSLVIAGPNRRKDFPDVPTFKEKGFTQAYINNWIACLVGAGVPQYVIDTLTLSSEKVVKSKKVISALEDKTAATVEYMSPAEFHKMLEDEQKAMKRMTFELGLKLKK